MHQEALMHAQHASNRFQRVIFAQVAEMKVGDRLRVETYDMHNAFPTHPLLEDRPPADQFLEKMIGANHGAWTCERTLLGDYYLIGHHETEPAMIRRDLDRRHLPPPDIAKLVGTPLGAPKADED